MSKLCISTSPSFHERGVFPPPQLLRENKPNQQALKQEHYIQCGSKDCGHQYPSSLFIPKTAAPLSALHVIQDKAGLHGAFH